MSKHAKSTVTGKGSVEFTPDDVRPRKKAKKGKKKKKKAGKKKKKSTKAATKDEL